MIYIVFFNLYPQSDFIKIGAAAVYFFALFASVDADTALHW